MDIFKMKITETGQMRDAKGKITYEKLRTLQKEKLVGSQVGKKVAENPDEDAVAIFQAENASLKTRIRELSDMVNDCLKESENSK